MKELEDYFKELENYFKKLDSELSLIEKDVKEYIETKERLKNVLIGFGISLGERGGQKNVLIPILSRISLTKKRVYNLKKQVENYIRHLEKERQSVVKEGLEGSVCAGIPSKYKVIEELDSLIEEAKRLLLEVEFLIEKASAIEEEVKNV